MSVALRTITRLQDADDINVSLGAGVDEYALCWDNDTAKFVLRAPFDGTPYALLAGRAGGQTLYGGTAANDDITIHGTSDGTRTTSYVLLQPTAGNVGIGTSAPGHQLHLGSGDGSFYTTTPPQLVVSSTTNNQSAALGLIVNEGVNNPRASFYVDDSTNKAGILLSASVTTPDFVFGNDWMTITAAGNVGIGTATPGAKLDIVAVDTGSILQLKSTNEAVLQDNVIGKIQFYTSDVSTNSAGVGAYIAAVGGDGYGEETDLVFATTKNPGATPAQERMRILGELGYVGILDPAPAEALDVTGNINTTGVYKVDDVQVLSNRVIDARCADVANSGDATTDGLIDALRDAMIAHGLIAAA